MGFDCQSTIPQYNNSLLSQSSKRSISCLWRLTLTCPLFLDCPVQPQSPPFNSLLGILALGNRSLLHLLLGSFWFTPFLWWWHPQLLICIFVYISSSIVLHGLGDIRLGGGWESFLTRFPSLVRRPNNKSMLCGFSGSKTWDLACF